jgi:hypothetical protein
MKKVFWLAAGITVGLVAAKQIEKNPKAKAAYDQATEHLKSLVTAFTEGYDEELKSSQTETSSKSSSPKTAK